MELTIFHHIGIALGLGLLVGFQREWKQDDVAGIRTFALITVLGALSAKLAETYTPYGAWILAAGLIALTGMLVLANVAKFRKGHDDPGLTTEAAVLLMYLVGAAVVAGHTGAAVLVGGITAVLLQWKRPLHQFARGMDEAELRAIVRLVLIGLVILPILPNETYGPYDVLNPFRIWLMVVLIVGISLTAYIVSKLVGSHIGTLAAGVFGGLISSTATTVGYSRLARHSTGGMATPAVVIVIASTIVFARVVFEIALVAPTILRETAPPLLTMMGCMALLSLGGYFIARKRLHEPEEQKPPSDIRAAIIFALLYAVVIFAIAAAKEKYGDTGLYIVAALSGLTDMDAITLSTAQFVKENRIDADLGWRLILIGGMANLVFKSGVILAMGGRRLLMWLLPPFAAALLCGALILWLWR